jgi:hypothetical protein
LLSTFSFNADDDSIIEIVTLLKRKGEREIKDYTLKNLFHTVFIFQKLALLYKTGYIIFEDFENPPKQFVRE